MDYSFAFLFFSFLLMGIGYLIIKLTSNWNVLGVIFSVFGIAFLIVTLLIWPAEKQWILLLIGIAICLLSLLLGSFGKKPDDSKKEPGMYLVFTFIVGLFIVLCVSYTMLMRTSNVWLFH